MEGHDRLLNAFLAGDLGPADARRFDEHLLECEACWRRVREDRVGRQAAELLRQPAPAGLADRIAFAVEVAATAGTAGQQREGAAGRQRGGAAGRPRWRLARGGVLVLGAMVALIALLLPGGRGAGSTPAAVAAVARYAQAIPSPAGAARGRTGGQAAPEEVGQPVTVTAGGQQITLRTWRVGSTEAVVAVSRRPFPMPADAAAAPGVGMAWSARLGSLGLYCVNGRLSELVAAPVPAAELARLAARLPLA